MWEGLYVPKHWRAGKLSGHKAPPKSGTEHPISKIYELVSADGRKEYDVRDLMKCLVDAGTIDEYKADYGKSIVCAFARLGGRRFIGLGVASVGGFALGAEEAIGETMDWYKQNS